MKLKLSVRTYRRSFVAGCASIVLLATGCTRIPAPPLATATPKPASFGGPACDMILNPDLTDVIHPIGNFYWMFSMNFKGTERMGCLRVWGQTKAGYVDISHGGIPITDCFQAGKHDVTIDLRYSQQWRRKLAVAKFGPGSYIECNINLMNELRKTDSFEDSSGQVSNAELLPETKYPATFALGAAGAVGTGSAETHSNTALVYEPDQKACVSQAKDPTTCKPLAQQFLRQGTDIGMRSYFNADIGGSQGANTGHVFLNTLNPSNSTQCSFAPAANPAIETQQQV